mmetsp:Transcript_18858/g.35963  ORF Transcript_18858/g.35963 Transcript_18858/m.35963 type:complete len:177 (+) Transcript_18858:834-1364(+)
MVVSESAAHSGAEELKADKHAIYSLLLAEKMLKSQGVQISSMLAEVIDPNIADQIAELHPTVSCVAMNEIMSLMTAGVVENRDMNVIWNELMSAKGHELYIKSDQHYMNNGERRDTNDSYVEELKFGAVAERARVRGEIAIGYRTSTGHLAINPDHEETIVLEQDGSIVVISLTDK